MYCPGPSEELRESKIEYRLYTWASKHEYILLNENAEPVDKTKTVDLSVAPLKVITHGWTSSADQPSVALIKDAYLETRYVNIVAVDWSTMADGFYCHAVYNVMIVGQRISRFLESVFKRYGVSGHNMHLIGHSLGAHVVGVAGSHTSLTIGRVTGLDPAGPLFYLKPPSEKIDISSADFVDIIHTCGGVFGYIFPLGHKDFYPNSGMYMQPGCKNSSCPVSCSHSRSYLYYVDTIYNILMYPSLRCESWNNFLKRNCDLLSLMGDGAFPFNDGTYYLTTSY